jgi:hypothetical protein
MQQGVFLLSTAAVPKPTGMRPPFGGGPPSRTTFDSSPSGDSDGDLKGLSENVNRLLATVDQTPDDRLDVLLRLVQQRKRWVENELNVVRMLDDSTLPPLASFSIEYLLEPRSSEESSYVRLLNQIDDAIFKVRTKMSARKPGSITSDS